MTATSPTSRSRSRQLAKLRDHGATWRRAPVHSLQDALLHLDTDTDAIIEITPAVTDLVGLRRARIEITDHGRWRPPESGPLHGDRGRGLRLVRALMDQVLIDHGVDGSSAGTRVTLITTAEVPRQRMSAGRCAWSTRHTRNLRHGRVAAVHR